MLNAFKKFNYLKSLSLFIATFGAVANMTGCARLTQLITSPAQTVTVTPSTTPPLGSSVEVWLSTADGNAKLKQQNNLQLTSSSTGKALSIIVNTQQVFQEIEGFGASFTDSSAWLMNNLKHNNRSAYDDLMNKLFTKEGISLNLLRHTMGTTDLSLTLYSYDNKEGTVEGRQSDPDLTRFSVAHDDAYIVPVTKDAIALNAGIKVMASPWSAPSWMKTTRSMIGGYLEAYAFAAWANYFIKFIDAFESRGIPIWAITMQNEPCHLSWNPTQGPDGYPGMCMTDEDQKTLIKTHFGPALAKYPFSKRPKLFTVDYNWDNWPKAQAFLDDSATKQYVDGTAFHCYWHRNAPEELTAFHNKFPDKPIYITECSSGTWYETDQSQYGYTVFEGVIKHELIATLRNWSQSLIKWNMVLDQNHGPIYRTPDGKHGCDGCTGFAVVSESNGKWNYSLDEDYYTIGHASKFIVPGARRIGSDTFNNGSNTNERGPLQDLAVKNPDGSRVLIVYNSADSDQTFQVQDGSSFFSYTLPRKSAVTFKW